MISNFKKILFYTFLLFFIVIKSSKGYEKDTHVNLLSSKSNKNQIISTNYSFYEDKKKALNFEQILKKPSYFKTNKENKENFGFTEAQIWFRFDFKTEEINNNTWFLQIDYPPLNDIVFYYKNKNWEWDSIMLGTNQPAKKKRFCYFRICYPIGFQRFNSSFVLYKNKFGNIGTNVF